MSDQESAAADAPPRGRLAQVIASRGGLAPAEAPFVIEHREALIYMLCEAAELEHGIMCQYLYAAFSLKQSQDEGLTAAEAKAVNRWRTQISHVATQEMLHLSLVQNLLSAIGAAPHLSRPNFPQPARHYPAGVQLALIPFGEAALRHFMFLERPEGMDIEDAAGMTAFRRAAPAVQHGEIVPRGQDFATVGHLYRSIEAGIAHLADKFGERALFVGPPRAQATQAYFGWPELVAVTDVASAQRAIDEILEQGEGPRGHWQSAHFGQFVAILDSYIELREANPAFNPVRPVVPVNVRAAERDADVPLVSDPVTRRVMDAFNVCYEILLLMLQRFFAHTEETDPQLKALADATIGLMYQAIKPLGDLVTTLSAGPEYPGRTAGPSFELFYESDYVLPHREAAWILLTERIRQAAAYCEPGEPCDPEVTDGLRSVRSSLTGIADALAAHLPAWVRGTPAQAEDLPTLLARAADFYRTVLGFTPGELLPPQPPVSPHDASLRDYAVSATTVRARLGASAPPGLLQAVAALQDLAVRAAPADQRADLIAELGQLQRALPPTIITAKNGPYLVTNVPAVRTPLGDTLALPPQLALCRCGGSARKPICDGACAGNGFTDGKDPHRVPDQRDTYPGQQVTVFDNRGICQHSGLCTDRLPVVFRTSAEPFVAPSGGRMDEIVRAVRDCPSGALGLAFDGTEARDLADWHGRRAPAIEITQDGPYRVTGAIGLAGADGADVPDGADGADVPRAAGASREHYALCRCGHSRNKPFCSGMHWYIEFRDPARGAEPTLFEWAGGLPALTRMTRLLYEKHVPADDLLAPLFAAMAPDYAQRAAAVLAEVFGGPALPAPAPAGPAFTAAQRARWVALASLAADEAGLPADPEFRAAFTSYLDWSSRAQGAPADGGAPGSRPRWDWSPAGPPAQASTDAQASADAQPPVALPGPGQTVSFEAHIKPLFRPRDRQSMTFAFDLWSYADVKANAAGIAERLRNGTMPCDGAWPPDKIDAFSRWTESGFPP